MTPSCAAARVADDSAADSTTHTTSTVRIMVTSEMSGDTNRPMAGCDNDRLRSERVAREAEAVRPAPATVPRSRQRVLAVLRRREAHGERRGQGCPPRASPLADQTLRLGRLGGRPGTFDSVCRRVVLDIRGRVRTGVGVGWCFDEARPHARHKRAYESEHLGPGAEPAKHNDSSVRVAFRPVNPVPTRGPAVASPRGSSDWEPSVFETRA